MKSIKIEEVALVSVEANEFSGGIWLLWDEEEIKIKPLYIHKFFMHAEVTSSEVKVWELSAVYASPCLSTHKFIWSAMDEIRIENPWLIIGNFNCVWRGEERNSGQGVYSYFVI